MKAPDAEQFIESSRKRSNFLPRRETVAHTARATHRSDRLRCGLWPPAVRSRVARTVARHALQRVAARDLLLEGVRRGKGDVARLPHEDKLLVVHAAAAQQHVDTAKDVLRHVQRARRLGHAAARQRPHLVPHVGVAVVEAHAQRP
eukprot:7033993-Prymnesium_polylepis.1